MDISIPDSLPRALQLAATHQILVTGQVLFHRRDQAQSIFVVQTSRVKLVRYTSEGKLVILQVVRALEALLNRLCSPMYMAAML
jgi:CRP/FNR family transcriptional regulator, dissimilatory nitrate respiration regulator